MAEQKAFSREYDGAQYGIDLNSPTPQPMAPAGATHAVLQETVYGWLKGTTLLFSITPLAHLTYGDFVAHIGCDAQEYRYDTRNECRVYTWVATDKPGAKFAPCFQQNQQGDWVIWASGSTQIHQPDDFIDQLKKDSVKYL